MTISLPCDNGFVYPRRNLKESTAFALKFIEQVRKKQKITVDVRCAVCCQNTLVPSDILNISKVGICNYCEIVEPQGNFVSNGQSFMRKI